MVRLCADASDDTGSRAASGIQWPATTRAGVVAFSTGSPWCSWRANAARTPRAPGTPGDARRAPAAQLLRRRRNQTPTAPTIATATELDTGWLPPVDASGAVKLLVTSRALRARRRRLEGYEPVAVEGPAADHVVAFDRGGVIAVATREVGAE